MTCGEPDVGREQEKGSDTTVATQAAREKSVASYRDDMWRWKHEKSWKWRRRLTECKIGGQKTTFFMYTGAYGAIASTGQGSNG